MLLERFASRMARRSCCFCSVVIFPIHRAFIASVNLMRRNLTKGQQAMALAMMYPEPEKGGRGKKSAAENLLKISKFKRDRLDRARSVLHHSRSLAESVLKGITPLDMALATVKEEQQFQQSDEAKLARLRESAPDLAEKVPGSRGVSSRD